MKQKTITVAGGDMRSVHLLAALREKPFCGEAHGLYLGLAEPLAAPEVLPASDIVIFGLPILDASGCVNAPLTGSALGLEEVFQWIKPGTRLFGGAVPERVAEEAARRELMIEDYITREEFAIRNALLTAEGALQIALAERESSLRCAECLVLGYGRIGKALTGLLTAFGARVSAAARKPGDLAWISAAGARPVPMRELDRSLPEYKIIFNTVPVLLMNERRLATLGEGCLVVDLASAPGGVDHGAANRLGLRVIQALSLPGKLKPVSAGEIILDTIADILEEGGITP